MMRFIMPVILIGISLAVFFVFTNSIYSEVTLLPAQVASYTEALDNSKALENERDKLTAKYNAINPDNLIKLEKLLPENVDNIRLILEIEKIASPYGMALKDVKYSTTDTATTAAAAATAAAATTAVQGGGAAGPAPKDYGIFDLEFSVSGNYNDFINFTKNLESNLRIVDISSITFSSDTNTNTNTNTKTNSSSLEVYKYDFKFKTYWLKN
jgi:Tfp pilus assembly protein PilO